MSDANTQNKNTLIKVMDSTIKNLINAKSASSVLGEKIEADGITIIPVSKVSIGFAGGGADVTDRSKGKQQNPAGTGASVTDTPLVFLVIKDGQVNVLRISEDRIVGLTKDLVSTVIAEAKKLINKAKEKNNK